MRRPELDYILSTMLDAYAEVSDLIFTVDRPLQVEAAGELKPVPLENAVDKLTPFQTEMIALNLVGENPWHLEELLRHGSCDAGYTLGDKARFRVNVFSQRGHLSIVLRKLNTRIPTLEELNLPPILKEVPMEKTGLVLVTGATGSGKTTTLAAMLGELNKKRAVHVITLEDPIEYIFTHDKATFNQRELGTDFDSYANGLRAAMRQAPKVILVGEMRDRETVRVALSAAETGHLVLSTLHTTDAGQTINRIVGLFEPEEQEQIRIRLADSLRWVISQRLVPRIGGGRYPLLEIMGTNLRVQEVIRLGESEGKTFYEIIEANQPFGWCTFDQSALAAYEKGIITEDTALAYCSKRSVVARGIDMIRKTRGEFITPGERLQLAKVQGPTASSKTEPAPKLKIK